MKSPRVAIIQPFVSHYRWPIFNLLSLQKHPDPEYVIVSDSKGFGDIKALDPGKAGELPQKGGLNWKFLKNRPLGRHFLWQSGLVSLSLRCEFDTIIYPGNMYHISTWVSLVAAKLTGKKTLMWTHGFLRQEKNLKGWIRERFYRLADVLLLYGHIAKQYLIARGLDESRLHVVYNSLDYAGQCQVRNSLTFDELSEMKKRLFRFPELPVLIFIGRLTPQKKLDMLIDALRLLDDKGMRLNLLFVGDGPERKILEGQVGQFHLTERVCFYGPCYGENEIGPLISMADLCASPGEVGLTCMHSLVYGTPVITHGDADFQMPEFEAIQPGKTGCFFSRDDVGSLANAIKDWLEAQHDRNRVRADCMQVIDELYNPFNQVQIINSSVLALWGKKNHSSVEGVCR